MSKAITDDPYESLGNAIIMQAVNDYRAALRRIKHNPKNRMAIDEALLRNFSEVSCMLLLQILMGSFL